MTDAPKTLLQMAGAPLDPSPLSESVRVSKLTADAA